MKRKRGRPKNEAALAAFETLCSKLEEECDNEMHTLNDLYGMMITLTGSETDVEVYSKDFLKQLLLDRSGKHIYFASRAGRDDVIGFSKFCGLLLHNTQWEVVIQHLLFLVSGRVPFLTKLTGM